MVGSCLLLNVVSVTTKQTRLLLILTPAFSILPLLANLPYALRRWPRATRVGLVVLTALAVTSLAPMHSRPPDTNALRQAYVSRLKSLNGTKYIWGGETHVGIDCSGLARTALWEAMAIRGIAEYNPRLLGRALWKFWWRDMSARAMLEQEYGYTRPIGHATELSDGSSIGMREDLELTAGDLAVTDNGVHVLIYMGDGKWIEANPDDGKVVINKAQGSDRPYFNMRVTLLRWWVLDNT